MVEAFPGVPILGNVLLGIGALSYDGQFNITVVADRDGCPDAEVFTAGLRATLDHLAQAASVPSQEPRPRAPEMRPCDCLRHTLGSGPGQQEGAGK